MSQEQKYDVIIIGTGAGGGTLVHALASTGKNILVLERGDYVRKEKANWDSRAVNVEGKYQTKEEWRDKDGKPLHPHTNYYVGGNTKFYGAALFRLRKEDFGEITTSRRSGCITFTANEAKIRRNPPRAARFRTRRSAMNRASSNSAMTSSALGSNRFTPPSGCN